SQPWQLVVKHRAGSLEKAVGQVRERDLAISFGMLLLLAASLITVVISSQRARMLGKLQMEFAAGVSHELRTPLAVIQSAAHNLRAGVVRDKEGIAEYATIVQSEARRLSDMVEHVMTYAETQSGRKRYDIAPIDAVDVVDGVHPGSNATPNPPVNGLGLHLVRKIIDAQHGAVSYNQPTDGGARFTLTIPAADSFFL